jgi:excisionase family DNA binding protein
VKTQTDRNAFSADEIAERNGLSRATVWKQMKEGRLPYRKVGTRRLILAEDERAWLGNTGAYTPGEIGGDARRRRRVPSRA